MLTFHHLISYMHLLLPFTAPCQCMQASLHDLNTHLDIPISMNRFRPNIVLDGEQPAWAEDQWGNRNICVRTQEGSAVDLEMCKPCSRCTVSLHALLNNCLCTACWVARLCNRDYLSESICTLCTRQAEITDGVAFVTRCDTTSMHDAEYENHVTLQHMKGWCCH